MNQVYKLLWWVVLFTWMQVSEAVQGQALNIETHFKLERGGLDECLGEQPAVLLTCNSTGTNMTHIREQDINTIWQKNQTQNRNNKH